MSAERDLLAEAAALAAARQPYVLATVVWCRRPTSGKPGAKALITADGQVAGWVGGACSEPVVVREAMRALEEGTPRLLHLGGDGDLPPSHEGTVVTGFGCASEGAVEIFVEPHLPAPQLVTIGDAPVNVTLAALARVIGFNVATDLAGAGPGSFVVVATMGHDDEAALTAALRTEAAYIALVASRKRGAAVLSALRSEGIPDEQLERVRTPAGLDLGPIAHEEIAVAILAEIVQWKAAAAEPIARVRQEAIDPVCGMTVDVATAAHTAEHLRVTYYFCGPGCRRRFEADRGVSGG